MGFPALQKKQTIPTQQANKVQTWRQSSPFQPAQGIEGRARAWVTENTTQSKSLQQPDLPVS